MKRGEEDLRRRVEIRIKSNDQGNYSLEVLNEAVLMRIDWFSSYSVPDFAGGNVFCSNVIKVTKEGGEKTCLKKTQLWRKRLAEKIGLDKQKKTIAKRKIRAVLA